MADRKQERCQKLFLNGLIIRGGKKIRIKRLADFIDLRVKRKQRRRNRLRKGVKKSINQRRGRKQRTKL